MRIIHASGKELRIAPGTVLEMERTNPFFNDYGEQSLPVTLPDCEQNRQTLGFPDDTGSTRKTESRTDAVIHEGIFNLRCRMAILSAGGGNGISTSFYLNEGSFYERIEDLRLPDLFKGQVIQFGSVSAAIDYCQGLSGSSDERFAIFPVFAENQDTGTITTINELDTAEKVDGKYKLYNATARTEEVNGASISIPAGFYISPQIRALYVLREAFSKLGYTLDAGFLGKTEPFASMVLLNANMDTIVGGDIKLEQLVPDCSLSELMDTFRGKFCCEFISDETARTVRITLFNELLDPAKRPIDLTDRVAGGATIDHSAPFRQLRLSCEKGPVITCEITDSSKPLGGYTFRSGTAGYLSKAICEIRQGRNELTLGRLTGKIYSANDSDNAVGNLSCDYFAGDDGLEAEEVSTPDTVPSIEIKTDVITDGSTHTLTSAFAPMAGKGRFLNSRIVYGDEKPADADTAQETIEQPIMLCGVMQGVLPTHDLGTVHNYYFGSSLLSADKIWDYSLVYNGEEGLFEMFWRRYDLMLRNAFRPVTYRMLLTEADKLTLSAHELVVVDGQRLIPDVLRYTVGRKVVAECDFLTTRMLAPTTAPPPPTDYYDKVLF